MKKRISILVLFATAILLISLSCKKENTNPDYVGTWGRADTVMNYAVDINLVLTTDAFKMQITKFGFLLGQLQGSFTVAGKAVTMKSTEVSILNQETRVMEIYIEGTTKFNSTLKEYGFAQTQSGEYAVSGSTLTLKYDKNGDGTVSNDEIQTFTKK